MRGSIAKLNKHPIVPGIALVAAVILISGQIFCCCHVNESIASLFTRFLPAHERLPQVAEHEHCGMHPEDASDVQNQDEGCAIGEAAYSQPDHCLCRMGFTPKPMLAGDFTVTHFTTATSPIPTETPARVPTAIEQPRPQNKSSPPVYLTTLRLLV